MPKDNLPELAPALAAIPAIVFAWARRQALIAVGSAIATKTVSRAMTALVKPKGGKMLEGKEIEKKFDGDAGEMSLDVDASGRVVIAVTYKREFVKGVEGSSVNQVVVEIPTLLRMAGEKSGNPMLISLANVAAGALGK